MDEAHSFAPIGRALRERRHRCRQIDPNNCTVRRDSLGKFQNSVTPATAYVEDALTRVRRKRCQSVPTKRSELYLQEFPDLYPRSQLTWS